MPGRARSTSKVVLQQVDISRKTDDVVHLDDFHSGNIDRRRSANSSTRQDRSLTCWTARPSPGCGGLKQWDAKLIRISFSIGMDRWGLGLSLSQLLTSYVVLRI